MKTIHSDISCLQFVGSQGAFTCICVEEKTNFVNDTCFILLKQHARLVIDYIRGSSNVVGMADSVILLPKNTHLFTDTAIDPNSSSRI